VERRGRGRAVVRPARGLGKLAPDLRGGPFDAGHFLPAEAPEETLRHLVELLT
jgi:haloacetate dehalogenase